MTGLLLALVLSAGSPAHSQEALPADRPAGQGTRAPTDLPSIVAARRTDHAYRRKWLRRAGGTGVAAAALWWLYLGDAWDAGDPATLIGGLGLVAVAGATLGGSFAGVYTDETALDWEASTPTLSLSPTLGGTSTVGEERPYALTLSASPRLRLSDGASVLLAGSVRGDLGWAADVDPRPQGAFDTALQARTRGFDLAPELRVRLNPELELRVRSQAQVRYDSYTYADASESQLRRVALSPLMAGLGWQVSGRQRFWFVIGPRFDQLAWRSPDDDAWSTSDTMLGPLEGEAAYEVHLPDPDWIPGAWEFRRRFRLLYEHSRFDGDGYNNGAMVGFFGPLELRYDVRARRPDMSWALQGALIVTLSDHGGVGLSLGVVPPRRERG